MPDRRTFLKLSATAGGALAAQPIRSIAGIAAPTYQSLPNVPAAPRSLRILILGGTGLTGPAQIQYAVARGHHITIFNRGRRQVDLPDGVVQLRGDRNLGELDALADGAWDVVIDNPTSLPFWVRDAGQVLADKTDHYVFISTLSVYDPDGLDEIDEETPTLGYADGDPLDVTPEMFQENVGVLFGPMKAASEQEALRRFGEDRTTIIRPGLIVGPRDESDRFTYWPVRIARGGDILAPGTGHDPVQIIDGRDLAEWTVRMVENRTAGIFNATGPRSLMTMAEQLAGIRGALPGDLDLRFHWAPAEFLEQHDVRPWMEMTTWFGPDSAMAKARNDRAVAAGLTFRPLAETVTDTLEWFNSQSSERTEQLRAGLAPDKEARVLDAWRAARG